MARGLWTLASVPGLADPATKEIEMYLGVGIVFALILVLASPLIWVAWWLLADLGQAAGGSSGDSARDVEGHHRRRAA